MDAKRELYKDGLPEYAFIRQALSASVSQALEADYDLIALGGHEQAIAHRIAVYLEPRFIGYHVDCEYNREKHKAKSRRAEEDSDKPRTMRPDIIVHVRDTSRNVLGVEMKANANRDSADDLHKLRDLKAEKTYLYKGAAFIRIHNALEEMSDGCLRATIQWYDVTNDLITEQEQHRAELVFAGRRAEVTSIVERRRK
ncbi:hypothetical protein ETAA8_46700 [Anatilimnocola aggregata]|uniref:Uncharacterized protein n=1 Tax=Anatilimnocola aggregata TaxID=2528021 RepID=A0A517YH40_9BACT|nr:hypothetical protein [Anatilimnocola aggregata]QDU29556.1 hypothetical protein ETAA8_46700 [Anatilimnocola aggregata]